MILVVLTLFNVAMIPIDVATGQPAWLVALNSVVAALCAFVILLREVAR